MYKKILMLYTTILCGWKVLTIILSFILNQVRLPMAVYLSTVLLCGYGVYLIVRNIIKKVTLNQLLLFCVLDIVCILFNLIYMRFGSVLGATVWEWGITGSFVEILLSVSLLIATLKKRRYITILKNIDLTESKK